MFNQLRKHPRGVMVHLRLPPNILAVIEPQAEHEGLRLASWIRRTIVMAVREAKLQKEETA